MPSDTTRQPLTYAAAGVDLDARRRFIERIRPIARSTHRPEVLAGVGPFGGLFQLGGYKQPVLVSSTDSVGTKVKIAALLGAYESIGVDVVNQNLNDVLTTGAAPLFFLDYLASSTMSADEKEALVRGIASACKEAGCALIGGESAEMPGHYQRGDYDLAGFAVGAVERAWRLPRTDIAAGDVLLGLASSGVHANGFSLVRKILRDHQLDLPDPAPFATGESLASALLKPTRIYVRSILNLLGHTDVVKGMAHITGGGLIDNIPRVLPEGVVARIDAASWQAPPVFRWLYETGQLKPEEMLRTFNCGIGMVLMVPADYADATMHYLSGRGETVYHLGELIPGEGPARVQVDGMDG